MTAKDARSLSAKAQERIRRRAVKAVLSGKKQVETAELLGVSRQAVGRWVKVYREKGCDGLKAKKQGRPAGGLLNSKQQTQIARLIKTSRPEKFSLGFRGWSREAVRRLIEQELGIPLSVWTVGRFLSRWGLSPEKSERLSALEQNAHEMRKWLEVEFPAIRK